MYNLGIIGGGPAGYVAAEKAAKAGLGVVLFETAGLGGVCLNEGCIPTKTLLYSAKLLEHGAAPLDFPAVQKRKDKVVKKLTGGIRVRLRNAGVEVVNATASVTKGTDGFTIIAGDNEYHAEKILVCTGSSAVIPPIPGLKESPAVVSSRELLAIEEIPESLVIIGGGVIGMEFASLFNSFGTKVSVVEMLPKILGNLDADISAMLLGQYRKKGVEFHLGCKVTSVEGNTVIFEGADGISNRISASKILVSVGRRPNLSGVEELGLETARGIVVDAHMRTSVPGVYAAGDVTALSMLAHTASRQGEVAVNHILGIPDEMRYNAIPSVVYTNPEAAGIGVSEPGPGDRVLSLPMAYSGRFVAENDRGEGLCKIVLDAADKVIGVHLLGNGASEIISAASVAITAGLSKEDLLKTVFPHPTVSEIIRETLSLN